MKKTLNFQRKLNFALLKTSVALVPLGHACVQADDVLQLEEIVVTAQKREQNIRDVPISVSAIGSDALEKRRITNFDDLAMAVPGLSIPSRGGAGDQFIFLRGMGSIQGSTPLVGLYLDEASITTFPGASIDLQAYDMERVEVLRGPQGTLYGVGSMGGTIKFIAKDPDLSEAGGRVDVSAGFTKGGEASYDLHGVLNVPLVTDKLGVRLVGTYVKSGGWMEQPALSLSDINDEELVNFRMKGLWRPSDDLEVRASVIIHRGDSGAPSTGEDEAGNYHQAFGDATTPSGKHNYELFNLTVDYDFEELNFLSTTSYINTEREQREVGYRVPFGTEEASIFHAKFDEDSGSRSFTQEVRLGSSGGDSFNWLVGGFYRDARLDEAFDDFKFGPVGGPFFFDVATVTKTTSWAVFGEASYDVTDRLEVGAGLRYFEDDQEGVDLVAGVVQTASFDALSPRFFIRYDLTEDVNVYASASKGFRSGGLAGGLGVQPFEPDIVWSYELGTKASLLDGRLRADVAVFYSDYKGTQVDSVNLVGDTLTQFTSNAGDAEIKGFDWDISYLATENLSVGFAGEVIDAEFVAINAVSASHAVGDALDFIPDYHLGVWGQYEFDLAGDADGYIRVDYNEQGPSRYGNLTICACYESFSDTINMLNISLGASWGGWSAQLYVRNLLNERGYIDAEAIEQIAARAKPVNMGIAFRRTF